MDVEQEKAYKLCGFSQKLFREAIDSFPLNGYSTITMAADGIPVFDSFGKSGQEQYLSECLKKRIIPFSRIKFEYNPMEKRFLIPKKAIIYDSELYNPGVIDGLIRGGRINHLILEGEFRKFKENNLLENILNAAGYQLQEADLLRDKYEDAIVSFRRKEEAYSLSMKLEEIEEKDSKLLQGWFSNIQDKHVGQEKLF